MHCVGTVLGFSHAISVTYYIFKYFSFSIPSFHSHVHVKYSFRKFNKNLKTKLTDIWKGFNTYTEQTIEDFLGITHLAHVLDVLFGKSTVSLVR